MPSKIEDYALIGDTHTAGLVSRDGSIDWLCLPRFDSAACFAALLGRPEHGRWLLRPAGVVHRIHRRYRPGTLILETEYETVDGSVAVVDCMPIRERHPTVVRMVEGRKGRVRMQMELVVRFDYGLIVPWVRSLNGMLTAMAGPDAVCLRADADLRHERQAMTAEFTVSTGQRLWFVSASYASHESPPPALDPEKAVETTEQWWRDWSDRCTYRGPWKEQVVRSLITLKAMTYAPTGGMVAAATTSLSEGLRSGSNWDYRFCWLRDVSFTLCALLDSGYKDEAKAWREWVERTVAGDPSAIQVVYGVAGERRLPEQELPWLPGHDGSSPVHIGNQAFRQFQLDLYGEVMEGMHLARERGIEPEPTAWCLQCRLIDRLESIWERPDEGIWEARGERTQFTYSKVMAWVALDRAVKDIERFRLEGPLDRWRNLRAKIHETVCRDGYNPGRGTFVREFGSTALDSSLLLIPVVGFLPPHDPRVLGTVQAIERELMVDEGLLYRHGSADSPTQGVFIACSFWLAHAYVLMGRRAEAERLFERLLRLCNDVGLLSEEYDPEKQCQMGNFPQGLSHLALVNAAHAFVDADSMRG
ncbi:MAG: glycoside hydrolase family 15 protein [Nitrospira sp.]|nr:glycoside hydrolase family 15 protein [Nitrospira sp.]